MIKSAVENAIKDLNQFPAKGGISNTSSTLTIMTGKPFPDFNKMKLEFGAVQVFEDNDPTNTTRSRTTEYIALTPVGNEQGGYFFIPLKTGKISDRRQWTVLPMPDGVVTTVENMALTEKQPLMKNCIPIFEWTPGSPIYDEQDTNEQQVHFEERYIIVENEEDDVENDIKDDYEEVEEDDVESIVNITKYQMTRTVRLKSLEAAKQKVYNRVCCCCIIIYYHYSSHLLLPIFFCTSWILCIL